MKLPNADVAIVERRKIVDYLLNAAHPDNGGKAAFFVAMGFGRESWQMLANALRAQGAEMPVSDSQRSKHGQKFIVDGEIATPVGKRPRVRSIWIIDCGREKPRLVTAYPLG